MKEITFKTKGVCARSITFSKDDDGKITHWHMVFFKDVSGNMTWLLSKPDLQEISIDKYII